MWSTAILAQPVQVESELIAEIRQPVHSTQGGATTYRFMRAKVVPQGEVVYYTVRVRNPATTYARDVVVVQKIPVNTAYVAGSASGPAADVSLSADGGRTFTPERKSAAPPRNTEEAASVQYTHVRWRFRNALAPGATALARFRAIFR
jgi:uncharacterized repeat protein (TIGR01451 family)